MKPFDPIQYYASYPSKIIGRPGYPARAAYKSAVLFKLFGKQILQTLGKVNTYADIGGCFGFGANAMAYQFARQQETMPETTVFEISPDFKRIGESLFPHLRFIEGEFGQSSQEGEVFDLITLFDVVEHVVQPEDLLREVASKCRFLMLLTPMETSGEWRGNKPPDEQGEQHPDGHINFFSPASYETLVRGSQLDLLETRIIRDIAPFGARKALYPEEIKPPVSHLLKTPKRFLRRSLYDLPLVPYRFKRKLLGGGFHLCLCRSQVHRASL